LSEQLKQRLESLSGAAVLPLLRELRRGIEKESLRIDRDGHLALTPHPVQSGSALTHPLITTDYSEALMEFITPVSARVATTLDQMDQVHRFVYTTLGDEVLWTASMPCVMGPDEAIPVAQYGSSNSGRMKTIYRVGLGHRYGRRMQTIAGIHYNFSIPELLWPVLGRRDQHAVTDAYFGLIRNFRRHVWLLVYLFGASPALCSSFVEGRRHTLEALDDCTLYLPYATSLRMGDLGYQSNAQESLSICYNRLETYIGTLKNAILDSYPDYERIGVKVDGDYRQLSTGLLQIENEFYSPIRPKRVARRGQTALTALAHGGVEYIEVRCIDVNPFQPLGIDADQMAFIDAFLLWCLLSDSPIGHDEDNAESKRNLRTVVNEGRRPGLALSRRGDRVTMAEWANALLDEIAPIAALLDQAHGSDHHGASLDRQRAKIANPALTPSAAVLAELQSRQISWGAFALEQSQQHAEYFRSRPLAPAQLAPFTDMAAHSLAGQVELERADQLGFDDYLAGYFDQYRAL
jgi:glutamate--cysteine ligase